MNAFDLIPIFGLYEFGVYQVYADPDKISIGDLLEIIDENDLNTAQELADYARANDLDIQVYDAKYTRI